MITRVVISNFKNFCGEETIVLSSPSDESYVDVLVGRNGSGKSCLLESIDWCLCNRTPRDIRASSMKDLVNINSVDGKMNVIVYIVRGFAKETQTLEVSRHFNGRTSKLECKLFSCGASEMIAPDCVPGLLADFGMAPAQMSGIRIKQHQSQVACRSPLELLTFIETMCGSIEKKLIIDDKIEEISRLNNTLKECNDSLAELKAKSSSLDPFVANIERCLSGLYLLRVLQMDLIDRRLDLLCADHADIKRRLGADSMTKKTILNDIIELEALISAANLSNALTNAAEKQHRKLYETTKRMQKRVNKDKDSQCRLISEQEALLMGLKRSISNGNKKV